MAEISGFPMLIKTIAQAMRRTTTVLMAVARFELTPSIPTFANIDVRAANNAEANANKTHIFFFQLRPQYSV